MTSDSVAAGLGYPPCQIVEPFRRAKTLTELTESAKRQQVILDDICASDDKFDRFVCNSAREAFKYYRRLLIEQHQEQCSGS